MRLRSVRTAAQDPPTSISVRKPVCFFFVLFFYSADVSRGSPGPSGKLAAVIRFDMKEDRKYEGEQKQGMVVKNGEINQRQGMVGIGGCRFDPWGRITGRSRFM